MPTKIGALLVEAAGINIAAMACAAFFFGALLATGLPPAPAYIITALVIAPPMVRMGVHPYTRAAKSRARRVFQLRRSWALDPPLPPPDSDPHLDAGIVNRQENQCSIFARAVRRSGCGAAWQMWGLHEYTTR
ncbi:MAG TPA: hypothetical protein VED01_02545 [Burkholderiales bacterium]|nr:hypothetical protein [Burkholderiales bacterium]